MKRILFVTYEYPTFTPYGGIAFYYSRVSELLRKKGFDVQVITARIGLNEINCMLISDNYITYIDCNGEKDFGKQVGAWLRSKKEYFDLIEIPHFGSLLYSEIDSKEIYKFTKFVSVRFHGFSIIASIFNNPREKFPRFKLRFFQIALQNKISLKIATILFSTYKSSLIRSFRELEMACKVDLISTTSDLMKSKLLSFRSSINIDVFPNPCQFECVEFEENSDKVLKILYLNRIQLLKGFDLYSDAARFIINSKNKQAEFLVCGDDSQWNGSRKLESMVSEIKFLGFLKSSDVKKLMSKIHVVVIPSRFESFSNVALEAMSMGNIVAIGNNVGIKEHVIDGYNGFIFNTDTSTGIRDCLVKIISMTSTQLNQIRKSAHETAIELSKNTRLIKFYNQI